MALPISAVDATGATLVYSATGLPTGLTIDPTAGTISGTVDNAADAQSPYNVTVTATDGTYSDAQSFVWTVISPSVLVDPTIVNPGDQSDYAGEAVSLITQDTGPYLNAVNFSADNLPDGATIDPNTGIISGTLANDAVSASPYSVTVSAFDAYGDSTSETLNWTVAPATLSITAPAISATQGVDPGTVNVATFTTPDTNSQASDFTATVDWGDGNSEQVQVTGANGSFTVPDDHVYTSPGSFTVTVSITDSTGGNADASAQATAAVADSLGASGGGLTGAFVEPAIVNQSASLTLAALESTDLTPSDFTVQIDWGDGSTPSPITLSAAQNGMYQISGQHLYTADGSYTATISVTDSFGTTQTTTSTVNVGDLYAGIPATLTLGSFTAPDPNTTYTATVAWGDGGSSAATVTETGGAVTIIGTHTYALAGAFQPTVTVTPAGAAPIIVNAPSVQVVSAQITLYASNAEATTGSTLLATFTDANPLDTVANFAATLIWIGGTPSTATITGGNGLFRISCDRTFTQGAVFAPQMELNEDQNLVGADQPDVEAGPVAVQFTGGPSIVPENSRYSYFSPGVADMANVVAWVSANANSSPDEKVPFLTASIEWIGGWVDGDRGVQAQFGNVSQTVYVNYRFTVNGVVETWQAKVDIVQVTVGTPATPFTNSGGGLVAGTPANYVGAFSDTFRYNAAVTLTAPIATDLAAIKVGFVQTARPTEFSASYSISGTLGEAFYSGADGTPLQGRSFLDVASGQPSAPFYAGGNAMAKTGVTFNGQSQNIASSDAPEISVPRVQFVRNPGDWFPSRWVLFWADLVSNFSLFVGAQLSNAGPNPTVGGEAGPNGAVWGEAGASWATNFSFGFLNAGFQGTATKSPLFGLTMPSVWTSYTGTSYTEWWRLPTNLPIGNEVGEAGHWIYVQG